MAFGVILISEVSIVVNVRVNNSKTPKGHVVRLKSGYFTFYTVQIKSEDVIASFIDFIYA